MGTSFVIYLKEFFSVNDRTKYCFSVNDRVMVSWSITGKIISWPMTRVMTKLLLVFVTPSLAPIKQLEIF